MTSTTAIPVTILGGYLGSGKTSLLNHLLRNNGGLKLAVMVNDFGNLPIDATLIEARHDDVISLSGGCVCCSYGNDLTMALLKLQERSPTPDQIIIESSGVALPGSIASTLSLMQGFVVDGVTVLVDADAILAQANNAYIADTIERQLNQADIILLNKIDLVNAEKKQTALSYIEAQNISARIVQAQHSRVPTNIILAINSEANWTDATDIEHASSYSSIAISFKTGMQAKLIAKALADKRSGVIRAKGFMIDELGNLKTLQVTGSRWKISNAPLNAQVGLVCIGVEDKLNKEAIEAFVTQYTKHNTA